MQLTRRWGICVRCALVLLGNEFYVETFTTELILAVSHTTVGYKLESEVSSPHPKLRHLLCPRKILTSNSFMLETSPLWGQLLSFQEKQDVDVNWQYCGFILLQWQCLHDFVSQCLFLFLDCEDIWITAFLPSHPRGLWLVNTAHVT